MMISTLTLGLILLGAPLPWDGPQVADTLAWRQKRETELKADQGWLAVSGLPWLKEGETTIGSGEGNVIRLPDGPSRWGTIERRGAKVTLKPADGEAREITTKDEPFQIGRTRIQLLKRSDLIGLRLWDPQNARKLAFTGLRWIDVKDEYRVRGRLIPNTAPTKAKIANVIGQVNDLVSPGVVEFELKGKKLQVTPVYETPKQDELFYIFKDATSGKTTYGAGRFMYSILPGPDGTVVLDFNRAYSPPCAFTDFATCPLPPPQNRLGVKVEAGELDPHKGH